MAVPHASEFHTLTMPIPETNLFLSASVRKQMVTTSLLIFKCNLTAIESAITSSWYIYIYSWYADLFIGRLGSWSPNVPLAMRMSLVVCSWRQLAVLAQSEN